MIDRFEGKYSYLSNFHPYQIEFEGLTYPTVEHAYQAAKTDDDEIRRGFTQLKKPGTAKKIGRMLPLRENWHEAKFPLMWSFIKQKFGENMTYGSWLRDHTGNEALIEGNTWHDNVWGVCSCYKCREIDGKNNYLGLFLMKRREELKKLQELTQQLETYRGGIE